MLIHDEDMVHAACGRHPLRSMRPQRIQGVRFRFPPVDEEFRKSLAHDLVGVHESKGPGNALSERVLAPSEAAMRPQHQHALHTHTHKFLDDYHKEGVRCGARALHTNKQNAR